MCSFHLYTYIKICDSKPQVWNGMRLLKTVESVIYLPDK